MLAAATRTSATKRGWAGISTVTVSLGRSGSDRVSSITAVPSHTLVGPGGTLGGCVGVTTLPPGWPCRAHRRWYPDQARGRTWEGDASVEPNRRDQPIGGIGRGAGGPT